MQSQKTISKSISFAGKGLHTGTISDVKLFPADCNAGIVFKKNNQFIPADCGLISNTLRCTTIEKNNQKISTIEHLLAAINGLEIDNILIEVVGDEIPILDGSSKYFVDKIIEVGIAEQPQLKKYFKVTENIYFKDYDKNAEYWLLPANNFSVDVLIDFNTEIVNQQFAIMNHFNDFASQIAPARTFCFLHEIENLLLNGLIKGADLNCAVVFASQKIDESKIAILSKMFNLQNINLTPKNKIINQHSLRFPNEPARHKLLDIIGDLTLVGTNIIGKLIAHKPGHSSNVLFAKYLQNIIKQQP